MDGELTAWIALKSGAQVRVKLCTFEDSRIPTPQEPQIARHPHLTEWPEIVAAMTSLNFTRIETHPHA